MYARTEAMCRVVMSEEVGKKVQAVVDRVNEAVSRRPKVSFHRFLLRHETTCFRNTLKNKNLSTSAHRVVTAGLCNLFNLYTHASSI